MNHRHLLSYLTLALLALLPVPCQAQQQDAGQALTATHYTVADGLTGNTVKAIVEDADGFLWMGGTGGLSRFDGYHFTDYPRQSSSIDTRHTLTSHHVGLLDLDPEHGLLWVSTAAYSHGGLDLRTDSYLPMKDDRTFEKQIYADGVMWFYQKGSGIRRMGWQKGELTTTDYSVATKQLPADDVVSLQSDGHRGVWGITTHALFRIDSLGKVSRVAELPAKGRGAGAYLALRVEGEYVCVATSLNDILVYGLDGKRRASHHLPVAQGSLSSYTHAIIVQDRLYIFTTQETIALDLKSGQFSRPEQCQIKAGLNQGRVEGCQFVANRHDGTLWLFPDQGEPYSLKLIPNLGRNADKGRIFNVVTDRQGRYAIATYGGGLFLYDPRSRQLHHYSAQDAAPLFRSDYLYAILADHTGCLWVAAEAAGVSCIKPEDDVTATYIYPEPGADNNRINYIRSLYREADGRYTAYTNDSRRYRFDPQTGTLTHEGDSPAGTYAYLRDSQGRVWEGTRGNGLFVDGTRYSTDDKDHYVPVNDFYDIVEDRLGRIWIATWKGGLLCCDSKKGQPLRFKQYLDKDYNATKVHDLALTPGGYLFAATYNGLYGIDARRQHIDPSVHISHFISNDYQELYSLLSIDDHHLWVGTTGAGAIRYDFNDSYQCTGTNTIDRRHGLASTNVVAITKDASGQLWLSTEQGVSRMDSKGNVQTYRFAKNILSNSMAENCAQLLPDGRLALGTMNGLCLVSQSATASNDTTALPAPRITGVKPAFVHDGKHEWKPTWTGDANDKVSLPHDANTLQLMFSTMNYRERANTLYSYRLEGADHDWTPYTASAEARYNQLPPGSYTFHLRAMVKGRQTAETTLHILIHEPWWNTWWAWLCYLAVVALIAWVVYRQWRSNLQLQQEMKLERQTQEYRQHRLADEILRAYRPEDTAAATVVIVNSDNAERKAMADELSTRFQVAQYATAREALDHVAASRPDLLVCDETLSDLSGRDLLAQLRAAEPAASLPVIMLTRLDPAQTLDSDDDDQQQLEQYAAGADDLLSKPFNRHLLLARAIQLVAWNKETPADVAETAAQEEPEPIISATAEQPTETLTAPPAQEQPAAKEGADSEQSERDRRFKSRLDYVIAQHLGDHDYSIDDLAAALQMGHTKFYGRVKEVTGMSPNKYLMQIRMATASELLLEGQYNVGEISYKVGFVDQGYFNKCFRKQFGVAPSKYGK